MAATLEHGDFLIKRLERPIGGFGPPERGVRAFHYATGLQVDSWDGLSEHSNRAIAIELLAVAVAEHVAKNREPRLLTCPFCGGRAGFEIGAKGARHAKPGCGRCQFVVSNPDPDSHGWFPGKRAAALVWNRRLPG